MVNMHISHSNLGAIGEVCHRYSLYSILDMYTTVEIFTLLMVAYTLPHLFFACFQMRVYYFVRIIQVQLSLSLGAPCRASRQTTLGAGECIVHHHLILFPLFKTYCCFVLFCFVIVVVVVIWN